MEKDFAKIFTSLFLLAVGVGVLIQVLNNPTAATTVFGATTDAVTGITHGLTGNTSGSSKGQG